MPGRTFKDPVGPGGAVPVIAGQAPLREVKDEDLVDNKSSSSSPNSQQQQQQQNQKTTLEQHHHHGEEKLPHYSRVADPIETLNPVTGRSIYYGARPWRCDDRLQDWLQSLAGLRWKKAKIAWKNFRECYNSEYGLQPTVPYETLARQTVMYYVDRQDHGMIRDQMFQRYPFSTRDFYRVMVDDGTKMRVWRHQRELEIEAKQGRVDELISSNVMSPEKAKKKNPDSFIGK